MCNRAFAMAVREGRFTQDCSEPLVEGTVWVPSHMWYRPFGNQADRIPLKTQKTWVASFYHDNSGPIATMIPSRCNK